jgi:ankyrin repeat protein
MLLSAGACLDAEDEDGMQPLHFSASSGNIDTCKALLAARADASRKDDFGRLAFDHLCTADLTVPEKRAWKDLLGPIKSEVRAPEKPAVHAVESSVAARGKDSAPVNAIASAADGDVVERNKDTEPTPKAAEGDVAGGREVEAVRACQGTEGRSDRRCPEDKGTGTESREAGK